MVYTPEAVVHHFHVLTYSGFLAQHFRYGRGAYAFRRRCVRSSWERVQLEPLSFYFSLLFYPLTLKSYDITARLHITLLFLLSQAANAAGYCYEALTSRRGPQYAPESARSKSLDTSQQG